MVELGKRLCITYHKVFVGLQEKGILGFQMTSVQQDQDKDKDKNSNKSNDDTSQSLLVLNETSLH